MNQSSRRIQPVAAALVRWVGWRDPFGCVRWVPPCALAALAAFPPLDWHALGWLALAPLALGLRAGAGGVAAWAAAGWGWGLLFFAVRFAWLQHAFVVQAGMGWLHFVNVFALLVAVLALVPAAVLAGARAAWLRWGLSPLAVLPLLLAGQDALLGAVPFGGVAWGSLAAPQAHTWAARLIVPVLGGAGLVLLLGLVSAGWGAWALPLLRGAGLRALPRRQWIAGAGWAALTLACGWPAPLPPAPAEARPVAVLLVPGDLSIAQLNAQRDTPLPLRDYLARTLTGIADLPLGGAARLVLWPESAVPGVIARGKTLAELSALGGLLGVDLLLGSNALERGREYNSAYLVNGGAFEFWRYDKQRLVPFGEYVPAGFRWLFPSKLTAGEADYAAGTGPPVLTWRSERLGLAICFESILPGHARAAVQGGATLLVAIANDAWLTPAARREHVQLTALRGLEVGRDVLLVANRGWSAHLRGGRAVALAAPGTGPLAVHPALRAQRTPFARWGHAPLALLAALLLGAAAWRRVRAAE
jgi:apolipoprotein N-acyltransferase